MGLYYVYPLYIYIHDDHSISQSMSWEVFFEVTTFRILIPSSTRYLEWGVPEVPRGGLRSPPDIRPFGGSDFRPLGPLSYVE